MNRCITLLLLTFLFVAPTPATAQVVDSPTFCRIFQRLAIHSIVKIHDRTDVTRGTGFVIGRDDNQGLYIMTCAHVAERDHRLEVDLYPHGSIDVSEGVEVVAHDERRDIAVIRIHGIFDVLPVPIAARPSTPEIGSEVFVAGFPHGERTCRITTTIRQETIDGRENVYLRKRIGAGASGSPVFACHGEHSYTVVGVYWGHTAENGIATADLQEFLRENSLHELQSKLREDDLASAITTGLEVFLEELAEQP